MVQTVWDNSPILLDWEAGLDRQVEFLQFCLELGNRSLLDLLFVQYAADNIDYIANIEAHTQDEDPAQLLEKLKGISVTFLNAVKSKFEEQINEFSKVNRDNKGELLKAINEKLEVLRKNFRSSITTASNEGKEVIKTFPEGARPFAGRQFSAMLTADVTVFREQTAAIKKITETISNPGNRPLPEAVEAVISEARTINITASDVAQKWIETIAGKLKQPSVFANSISDAELARAERLSFTKTENGWEVRSI